MAAVIEAAVPAIAITTAEVAAIATVMASARR